MKKSSTFKFIIYNTALMFFGFVYISNHVFITQFSQISFFIPLILGILAIIFFLFLPKTQNNYLKNLLSNPTFRILIFLYLFVSTVLFNVVTIFTTTAYFYKNMPFIQTGIIFALMIAFLGSFSLKKLYDVSTFVFILLGLFNLILLLNTSEREFFLPANLNFEFNNIFLIFTLLYLFFDGILFYFFNIEEKEINVRKGLIISTIIATTLSSFIIFNNYTYYVYQYLETAHFPAFSALFNYIGPEIFAHFDLILLINIIPWLFLKGGMNARFANVLAKNKPTSLFQVFIIGIAIIAIIIIYRINIDFVHLQFYIGLFLTSIILIIYFYLIYLKEKGKHEQSNLELTNQTSHSNQ